MYPKPYVEFLVQFHGMRDYFECHEILEEHWKTAPSAKRNVYWVGLIQVAVALYHHRRNNFTGALRMMQSAVHILKTELAAIQKLGLDAKKLIKLLQQRILELEHKKSYVSLNLPVVDKSLQAICEQECQKIGCTYGIPSDITNEYLINKHRLRNRQEVINERNAQKELRKKKRQE